MTPGTAARPLIFLDVDGPLITFRARPVSRRLDIGQVATAASDGHGNPLLERLDPDDGRRLLALGGQLVWATTWGAEANEIVAPRLGLPDLPEGGSSWRWINPNENRWLNENE